MHGACMMGTPKNFHLKNGIDALKIFRTQPQHYYKPPHAWWHNGWQKLFENKISIKIIIFLLFSDLLLCHANEIMHDSSMINYYDTISH